MDGLLLATEDLYDKVNNEVAVNFSRKEPKNKKHGITMGLSVFQVRIKLEL